MSNLYRGPSIDASYQVSVHLTKWFQRRRFKKIGQSETRINGLGQNVQSLEDLLRCFLPSFSSFGSGVSEEKIKMWKVNGRQTTDAKSSHCLWQGELKIQQMAVPTLPRVKKRGGNPSPWLMEQKKHFWHFMSNKQDKKIKLPCLIMTFNDFGIWNLQPIRTSTYENMKKIRFGIRRYLY
jgi:hypothetical protein